MRRWLLLGAALVAAGAVAIAYALTRLNDYLELHRGELAAQASAALGREVTFATIDVSLRGGGSARITDLRVADDPRFGGDFVRAESAVVAVSLLEMLRGRLHVRSVVIDAPTVALVRDASGWNVDSLRALHEDQPLPAAPAAPVPSAPAAPLPSAPVAPAPSALATLVPSATALPANTPLPSTAPDIDASVLLESVRLRDGTATVTDRSREPPTSFTIEQVDLRLAQPAARAPIALRGAAALFGSARPNALLAGTITPGAPAVADVRAQWDPVPIAGLEPVVPMLGELAVDGQVGGDLHFDGPFDDPDATLTGWLARLSGALDLRDLALTVPAIGTRVSGLSGSLRFAPDAIELAPSTARLGDTPVSVGCRLAPPADGVAQCRLTAAAIDLRQLSETDGALRGVVVEATLPPLDPQPLLRATIQVADGQVRDAAFRDLSAAATWQEGTLAIERAAVQTFGGTVRADGGCTGANGPTPACILHGKLESVQIAAALTGLRSKAAQRVDGRLDAELRLTTSGRDAAAVRRSARGTGSVRVTNGVVQGVNLAERVLGAVPGVGALLRSSGRAADLLGSGATRFDRLTATVHIANEQIASNEVALSAEDYAVTATGTIGFAGAVAARGTFHGSAPLVADLASGVPVLGKLAASIKGIVAIPFTEQGTLANPKVEPDLSSVAGGIGRDAIDGLDALFGAPDPKRGKRGGVLRKGLDDLFGD